MLELVLTVLAVIAVSALCSLMEAILYAVPVSHVESLANEGNTSGKIMQRLRKRIDQPITAILSLNTIANTAGAAIAGALATKAFGSAWFGLFSGIFTLAILLLSEVVPKTIGVVYARPLVKVIARPLQLLVWILKPFIWMTGLVTSLVAKGHESELISEDELIIMARMGMRKGVIDKDELAVIQNILSLEDKTVRNVMTPRTVVFALSAHETIRETGLVDGILTHSRIPLYFKHFEDVEGIVHRRDILNARFQNKLDLKLEELMKPVHFVYEKTRLDKVLKLFLDRAEHLFVVIDEFGGLAGVVSLEDVLEEILGREIVDEFDQVTDMRKLAQKRRQKVVHEAHNVTPVKKNPDKQ